jgi:hypothetical protein
MRFVRGLAVGFTVVALACGDGGPASKLVRPPDAGDPDSGIDGEGPPPDTAVDLRGCQPHAPDVCGDGVDNNCDGSVDEGCPCELGAVQPCFAGAPGQRNVGACHDGVQRCIGEPGRWGACSGGISPAAEVCNGLDDDCDGVGDPAGCSTELACPAPGALPDAQLYQRYTVDGTRWFTGAALGWSWKVSGGACDQLFASQLKPTSFTLDGDDTSQPVFTPTQVGDYTVRLSIATAGGPLECTSILHVAGPGMRTELCWDNTGMNDLDLHLHEPHSTVNWFDDKADCYYANCGFESLSHTDWGYPQSPLATCAMDADPKRPDGCRNPRLEAENVFDTGRAETLNIDRPEDGATYRAMANYFVGGQITHPIASIYCGGRLVASYGQAPDAVPRFQHGGADGGGSMWRIADITTHVDENGATTCDVAVVRPPGEATGYDVTDGNSRY